MLANLLHRNLPSPHTVTLLAIRTELAFVDISVAVGALVTYVGEYRFHVALRAGYSLMQAPQGETGLVMIELGHAADRFPPAQGMAILARNVKGAVRTTGVGI